MRVPIATLTTGNGTSLVLQCFDRNDWQIVATLATRQDTPGTARIFHYATYELAEAEFHALAKLHVNQYWD